MKHSIRRTEQRRSNKGDLLWRKISPSRFLLVLSSGDSAALSQDLRNQKAHLASELLVYRNKSGDIVNIDFRQLRYRGTLLNFIDRIVSAHTRNPTKTKPSSTTK